MQKKLSPIGHQIETIESISIKHKIDDLKKRIEEEIKSIKRETLENVFDSPRSNNPTVGSYAIPS